MPKAKKQKVKVEADAAPSSPSKATKVTLRLGPKPKEPEAFPCCLCVSMSEDGLLRVQDPPGWWYDEPGMAGMVCRAHTQCASVIPETWVDEVEVGEADATGNRPRESVVFGVDGIVKDRWALVRFIAGLPSRRLG